MSKSFENSTKPIVKNTFHNLNLNLKQMQALSNIITAIVNIKMNRLNNELRQLLQTTAQSTFSFSAAI